MSHPFIPMVTSGGTQLNEENGSFQSVSNVSVPPSSTRPPLQKQQNYSLDSVSTTDPKVTLKRDGDKVTHICVQCSCGKFIELACEY